MMRSLPKNIFKNTFILFYFKPVPLLAFPCGSAVLLLQNNASNMATAKILATVQNKNKKTYKTP